MYSFVAAFRGYIRLTGILNLDTGCVVLHLYLEKLFIRPDIDSLLPG